MILPPKKDDSCVLWLDFASVKNNTVYDQSGNNNHGKVYGAQHIGRFGLHGLHFDGVDDYVDCGNDASLNMTKELTAIVVVKVKGLTGNYQMFFSKVYNKAWAVGMMPDDSAFRFYTRRADAASADMGTAGTPQIGEIQFLAMTYHYQQGKNAYLDGEKIGHWDLTGELAISSYDVWIGREATGHYPANADIYFVALYNRALSDAEIRELYYYLTKGIRSIVPSRFVARKVG